MGGGSDGMGNALAAVAAVAVARQATRQLSGVWAIRFQPLTSVASGRPRRARGMLGVYSLPSAVETVPTAWRWASVLFAERSPERSGSALPANTSAPCLL